MKVFSQIIKLNVMFRGKDGTCENVLNEDGLDLIELRNPALSVFTYD